MGGEKRQIKEPVIRRKTGVRIKTGKQMVNCPQRKKKKSNLQIKFWFEEKNTKPALLQGRSRRVESTRRGHWCVKNEG